jgi:ketosteroid isomerase-like protein
MKEWTKDIARGTARWGTLLALAALIVTPTSAHPVAHKTVPAPAKAQPSVPAATSTAVDTVLDFHAALARGDTDTALALMAENALIFESGGVERSRAEYAGHHLKADAEFSAAVRRTLVDRSSGADGNTAWVMSVEKVTGTYRNRTVNSRSVETILLRRIDRQWRIVHIHWSSADI